MYALHYGFREKPFALSPDPRYLFLSASHREVLGHLVYGVEQGEGFMAISGEVGTGKSTIPGSSNQDTRGFLVEGDYRLNRMVLFREKYD